MGQRWRWIGWRGRWVPAWSVLWLLLLGMAAWACDPEPGPQHFPPPDSFAFPVGYFEAHTSMSGLPSQKIRSLLCGEEWVLAGTEGDGLLLFREGNWVQFGPKTNPSFPAETVAALFPGKKSNQAIAGTVSGLVMISNLDGQPQFEPLPLKGPLGTNVLALGGTPDDLLAGTDSGAGAVTQNVILPYVYGGDALSGAMNVIHQTGKDHWLGGSQGLFRLDGTVLSPAQIPGADFGWVYDLETIGDQLIVAAAKGLFQAQVATFTDLLPGIWSTAVHLTPSAENPFASRSLKAFDTAPIGANEVPPEVKAFNDRATALQERYQTIMDNWQSGVQTSEAAMVTYINDVKKLSADAVHFQCSSPLMKGLWVGTQEQGVIFFANDGKRRHLTTENSKLPGNRITCIAGREDGETWIGTYDAGLLRYTKVVIVPSGNLFPIWQGKASLVRIIGENLYIGTPEDGLLVFHSKTLNPMGTFSDKNVAGFHKMITGICGDQRGRLWVTGNQGVWMRDDRAWHPFTEKEGLPDRMITGLEIDSAGGVYVSGGPDSSLSDQLAVYNGAGFSSYSVKRLRKLLKENPERFLTEIRYLGLLGRFEKTLDTAQASAALDLYDRTASGSGKITAMAGTPHYLQMGTTVGDQFLFDGESFKPLSAKGTGTFRRIIAIEPLGSGRILTLGEERAVLFDGQDYQPVFPMGEPGFQKFTDETPDNRNPDLFWASFEGTASSGIALYQTPLWKVIHAPEPVKSLAVAEPFYYIVQPDGVYRGQF